MRILKVSDVYFPRVNGVSTSIHTFTGDLQALGHEVTLVAPQYAAAAEFADRDVRRVASRPVPRDPEDRLMNWGGLLRLAPELARDSFDVVHIHTPFLAHYAALRYAQALGIPVVATYHTFFEEYLHHYLPIVPRAVSRPLARAFSRTQCNQVAAIVSPSIAMRDALVDYGVTQHIEVLPTGLPADRFRAGRGERFRAQHGIAADRPLLLYVGRLAHEKNIDFLIEAHTHLRRANPDPLLLIAGEGPASEALRQSVRRQGLDGAVQFVGYLERNTELLDCYHAADLFVFASRTETQGLVLLEAMAQGVPVVALAAMGTVDILSPGRGCVVAKDDPVAFAGTTLSLLGSPATRAALGDAAREYAESWSSRRMAERLAALYERVTRPQIVKSPRIAALSS